MRLTDILKCRTAFSIEEADSRIEEILRTVKKTQSSPMTH